MAKRRGRRPWSPPDGVKRQRPAQTAKTNAQRGTGSVTPRPKSPYAEMRMQQKTQHSQVRPGYGPTGGF